MLTIDRLKELLHYDPLSGLFIRKVGRSGPRSRVGDFAGSSQTGGYAKIFVDSVIYKSHRLAWFYHHGEWPKGEVDHINGIKSDNRIANLRDVSRSQNRMNVGVYASNKAGIRGVSWSAGNSKWRAQIQVMGKKISLGYYATIEDANASYQAAAKKYHGEYARD